MDTHSDPVAQPGLPVERRRQVTEDVRTLVGRVYRFVGGAVLFVGLVLSISGLIYGLHGHRYFGWKCGSGLAHTSAYKDASGRVMPDEVQTACEDWRGGRVGPTWLALGPGIVLGLSGAAVALWPRRSY